MQFFNFVKSGCYSELFRVALEHNGIFCGRGSGCSYMSASVAFIDYCNKDTWSILWIEDMLKQLGYEMDGKL